MNLCVYWRCLAALATLLSLVLAEQVSEAGLHTNTTGYFARRAFTFIYANHPKGLLMLKDQQTFCQATLLSSTAAVLAASCFDYDGNKQADISQYNLAIEMGDATVVTRAQISNITPHPNYDPVTFANNIAVIRFTETTTNMSYMIDNVPSLLDGFMHAYYNLNTDNTQWNEPQPMVLQLSDQNDCAASSSLFQAYQSDFICTTMRVRSIFNDACNIPYMFIVDSSDDGGILGFYSHSSLDENTEFCNNDNIIYNYYLNIAHYIPWINLLIDPDVQVGNRQNIAPDAVTESYSMASPASGSTNGRIIRSLYKSADVLPVVSAGSVGPPLTGEVVTAVAASSITDVLATKSEPMIEASIVTVTETTTDTEVVSETITSISATTADQVTVTVADTIINTEQLTNIVSTTQDITTTSDRTTTVSETVTTTATATATETVTATLLQTLTGTLTTIQSNTLIQSQTLTSLITTTAVSMSECPVVTCNTPTEIDEFTVTETEMDTSVETQTVTVTELGKMTVGNHEFSAVVVTVTISQPPETITQTVASDQSIAPITVTSVSTKTLVVSETETLDGSVESIFATVTKEIKPSNEPEPETKSNALQPWMIALIAIIVVVVLLIMVLLGYLYYQWKRRQREQYLASLVTPANYPQEYINPQYKEKGNDGYDIPGSYNLPEERQSRYNSKGNYVGYT